MEINKSLIKYVLNEWVANQAIICYNLNILGRIEYIKKYLIWRGWNNGIN